MTKLVNWKHFNEYQRIFGFEKMDYLWQEYLTQANRQWQELPSEICEKLRLTFHSWKSSSQVFGLDEFAHHCSQIEENILSHRNHNKVPTQIATCRDCFEDSIAELIPYFEKWKHDHE